MLQELTDLYLDFSKLGAGGAGDDLGDLEGGDDVC
jgi:hypothetical protein